MPYDDTDAHEDKTPARECSVCESRPAEPEFEGKCEGCWEPKLLPLPEDPNWHEEASNAAEEIAAWVAIPPLNKWEEETLRLWLDRLQKCLAHLGLQR